MPPPARNAWPAYAQALDVLATEPVPEWLNLVFEKGGLDAPVRAYLDRQRPAVALLRAGAARERCVRLAADPGVLDPSPDLRLLRALAQVAAAQARRERQAGAADEALDLAVDVYRYGTHLAEPDSGLLWPLVAAGCRRTAAAALVEAVNEGSAGAEALARAAREVAAAEAGMPQLYDAMRSEWTVVQRTLAAEYLDGRLGATTPPGLRARLFKSFVRRHEEVLAAAAPVLRGWDVAGAESLDRSLLPGLGRRRLADWLWPADALAVPVLGRSVAPFSPAVRLLYVDRANAAALVALLSVRAYERRHRRLPTTLAEALAFSGAPPLPDPRTRRPAGYRLERKGPVVWLPGPDGRDDGGFREYEDPAHRTLEPGRDLVYRLGERPVVLRLARAATTRR